MSTELGPYPAYRDSGVRWLGKVPEHWEVAGLGYRYEQCLGKMLDGKRITGEHLVPYLRNADVQWDEINVADLPRMDIHPDEIPRYTVQPGDLLVCEGGEVGRCAIWKGEIDRCGFQKALHRLRPRHDERDKPKFLYYALSVAVICGAFADGHESTIAHLTGEKLRRHRFAFPCADEQAAIARFLEAADRRIRRYIRAKERLVELLEERKRALINEAVTGRIDVRTGQPYPAYKDSGVEWLGKVPEHWEVRRNKSMLSRRKVLVGEDHPEFDLLSLTKGGVIIRDLSTRQGKFSADPGTCQEVRVGDLVFCLFDVPETPRTVGLSGHHGMITGAYTVLECPDRVLRRFLEAFYIAMDDRKLLAPLYSGLRNTIPPSSLLRARSPVPPLPEQRAIVRYLDAADRRIQRQISATQRQIDLLQEYRTRLIADVVTGKLDVREAATRLPETNPLAGDRDRIDTIPTESNLHSTANEIAKEGSA